MSLDPVRVCCGQRHYGAECPDGKVMCCLCFERVSKDGLHIDSTGARIDVCLACAAGEANRAAQETECEALLAEHERTGR